LNFKLPDGSYLIPTPQTVDPSKPFASSGFSVFTQPCTFNEDQGLGNVDYVASQKSRFGVRFFIAENDQVVTFPGGALIATGNTHGFNSPGDSAFFVFSLSYTYVLSNALLNEARIGFVRTRTESRAEAPFKWSDVGVSESNMNENNELPSLSILGSVSMASVLPRTYSQNSFEFNDVLNANDFFLNRTGQSRPALKQNQFGFALGGPIKKDKVLFFGSYQGTRQVNGTAAGQSRIACSASFNEPPLTIDRSPAALGKLFGGLKGALGGIAINSDGSNINPVALALLNFKLPDGSFLIPTPQTVDPSKPFTSSGFSAFTQPCTFNEDQGLGNVDYVAPQKSRFGARFFIADVNQLLKAHLLNERRK